VGVQRIPNGDRFIPAGLPPARLTPYLLGSVPRWKDGHHAKAFPVEFRRDVVAVARKGEAPLTQIAKDFGISESCLHP
jgi:hypothetical protein